MSLIDTASLIVTPNGYKEGKLYSVIPSDGSGDMSVVRATTATRVNSAGLVELVPYNLLTYSEQFDNAAWVKSDSTITANSIDAPNGTLTADKFIPSNASINNLLAQNVALNANNPFFIYAKKGEFNYLQLLNFGTGGYANFDLENGVLGTNSEATSEIENVGNGWYKCAVIFTTGAITAVRIAIVTSSTSTRLQRVLGNGTSGIYLWGAQANEGSTAKDYQKTETRLNIPRLDYSNGTCPSLLVEPQRTNLVTYSSSFDNADWAKSGLTITANQTISPSGVQDADLFDDGTASNTVHWMWQGQSLANSTTYTISFYAKYISRKNLVVNIYNGSTSQFVNYDIQNGAIFGSTGDVTATIESVGNGWYRCTYTRTMASSGSPNYRIGLADDSGNQSYTGSNKQAYFWGMQLEAGSYPTSYIPTTSASVTRNADVISKTGISSLIGQTEGTMFVEFINDNNNNASIARVIALSDGTANNRLYLAKLLSGASYFVSVASGTQTGEITGAIMPQGIVKIALAYNTNDVVMYVNGSLVGSDLFHTTPATSNLYLGQENLGTASLCKPYNAAALWKTRLTNAELAQLTTI